MSVAVIAHRGASSEAPENTLAAFERAIELGVDFVELDVQVSSDGELIVFHDLTLERLTPLRGAVRSRTAAELAAFGIPRLEEALELTRGRVGVMAELKRPWLYRRHDVVRRTSRVLGPDDVLLSFERRALEEASRLRSDLRLMQHVGYGTSIRRAATYAWGVGVHDLRLTRRSISVARRLGLRLGVYTVNDPARMRQLAELGVDGIFTDAPGLLRATLDGRDNVAV